MPHPVVYVYWKAGPVPQDVRLDILNLRIV